MSNICSRCKVSKPLTEYHKHSGSPSGLRTACKLCVKRDRNTAKTKRWGYLNRFKQYGITEDMYNDMRFTQNYRCAICCIPESALAKAMCIDHNHRNGEVRGLLCPKCNKAIGLLVDSSAVVFQAYKYLKDRDNE